MKYPMLRQMHRIDLLGGELIVNLIVIFNFVYPFPLSLIIDLTFYLSFVQIKFDLGSNSLDVFSVLTPKCCTSRRNDHFFIFF